ncbi:Rhamnogalacturonate lyase [Linum perenne]
MKLWKSSWLFYVMFFVIGFRSRVTAQPAGGAVKSAAPAGGVKVTSDDAHVTIDNGLMQLTLTNPGGILAKLSYQGQNNLLETHEPKIYGGYYDVAFQIIPSKEGKVEIVKGETYTVMTEKEDIVEVSFSRIWTPKSADFLVPLNVDKRFIVRKGVPGFYAYVVVERTKGFPDVDMNQHRYAFKPNKTLFNYMALTDEIQRTMPTEADRLAGTPLAYKEAVLLNKGGVDDKYEYSMDKKDLKIKGWISDTANVGFWMLQPSDEYMAGGPKKNELTCHCGPTATMAFTSTHYYGLDMLTEYRNGEAWKKIFGPIFIYLNSGDRAAMWKDAKAQLDKEIQSWPYDFVQYEDYLPAAKRGTVSGQLFVDDEYLSPSPKEAVQAHVGLGVVGTRDDEFQFDVKGYNFWVEGDAKGNFVIKNVRPGDYNLYAYVIGVVGTYKHSQLITVKPGQEIKLGRVTFKSPRVGPTIWEIGIPDRSANEFFVPDPDPKYANPLYRQYGLWSRYAEIYPKEDLIFNVGVSKFEKDWFFAHVLSRSDGKTNNPTTWKINFDLPSVEPGAGDYTLHLALASAQTTNTYVYVNDVNAKRPHYMTGNVGTDNAIARHGNHGLYRYFNGTLPGNLFVKGKNTLFLRPAKSTPYIFAGVMYDYIRLEGPPAAPIPIYKEL